MSNFGIGAAIAVAFLAEREAHVTEVPTETELEKALAEAKEIFPAGRIVRLKSSGPNMTVQRVYLYDDGDEEGVMVDCLWFPSTYNNYPATLSAGGGAGGSVEYGREVQQFDFHPDTIIGV